VVLEAHSVKPFTNISNLQKSAKTTSALYPLHKLAKNAPHSSLQIIQN